MFFLVDLALIRKIRNGTHCAPRRDGRHAIREQIFQVGIVFVGDGASIERCFNVGGNNQLRAGLSTHDTIGSDHAQWRVTNIAIARHDLPQRQGQRVGVSGGQLLHV